MLYRVIRQIFTWIFMTVYRWDVRGRENIPEKGPFIMCANHISWWDPPLVGALTKHPARFMSKTELFEIPIMGFILPRIGVFPVKRESADLRAIKTAIDTLKAGGNLGMFPEGTRSRTSELLPPQAGVGLIAIKSQAPVVPIAIIGPYKPLRRLKVRIGKPMMFTEYYGGKAKSEHLEAVANLIMAEIARLRQD